MVEILFQIFEGINFWRDEEPPARARLTKVASLVNQGYIERRLGIYFGSFREMDYIERSSFIEICWSLVSPAHFRIFTLFWFL